jgi:hypothetical protein
MTSASPLSMALVPNKPLWRAARRVRAKMSPIIGGAHSRRAAPAARSAHCSTRARASRSGPCCAQIGFDIASRLPACRQIACSGNEARKNRARHLAIAHKCTQHVERHDVTGTFPDRVDGSLASSVPMPIEITPATNSPRGQSRIFGNALRPPTLASAGTRREPGASGRNIAASHTSLIVRAGARLSHLDLLRWVRKVIPAGAVWEPIHPLKEGAGRAQFVWNWR